MPTIHSPRNGSTGTTDEDKPKAPGDPRQCQNCYNIYYVLVLNCPECDSPNTHFVDEDTHEETDGFGNKVDRSNER